MLRWMKRGSVRTRPPMEPVESGEDGETGQGEWRTRAPEELARGWRRYDTAFEMPGVFIAGLEPWDDMRPGMGTQSQGADEDDLDGGGGLRN